MHAQGGSITRSAIVEPHIVLGAASSTEAVA
jgi:hypothetical protein